MKSFEKSGLPETKKASPRCRGEALKRIERFAFLATAAEEQSEEAKASKNCTAWFWNRRRTADGIVGGPNWLYPNKRSSHVSSNQAICGKHTTIVKEAVLRAVGTITIKPNDGKRITGIDS